MEPCQQCIIETSERGPFKESQRCTHCQHPLGERRALGFDKEMRQTGTYCQKCGTVLERFRDR